MKIVILTGAGVSAESGLGTFRDKDGLWTRVDLNEVATPEGFARDPARVHAFYNMRRKNARAAEPNAAHFALARLQARNPEPVVIVTQNVDRLHAAAGSDALHMHGRHDLARCTICDHRWKAADEMTPDDLCPACSSATTRPDIVWFGETPQHLDEIASHLASADLFAAIGTSGQVYPAAGFVQEARLFGARTVEINLLASDVTEMFDDHIYGPATEVVPAWVDRLLRDV
ncbi:MAG: NAD-dependent deacylase [Silicimonas sp.]|nr:NAD-dependent deacylase [Silicimonas sp.]NNL35984.1 NAD-dependent deacylase [Silicimonas sp.]